MENFFCVSTRKYVNQRKSTKQLHYIHKKIPSFVLMHVPVVLILIFRVPAISKLSKSFRYLEFFWFFWKLRVPYCYYHNYFNYYMYFSSLFYWYKKVGSKSFEQINKNDGTPIPGFIRGWICPIGFIRIFFWYPKSGFIRESLDLSEVLNKILAFSYVKFVRIMFGVTFVICVWIWNKF